MNIRLLHHSIADGPHNMAADEVLLQAAIAGRASLRFYGWTEATLSLGYFQPSQIRFTDPLLAALPWVRRPTGGATLVHHHELTYALAVPLTDGKSPRSWMCDMHRFIAAALESLACISRSSGESIAKRKQEILCFHQPTPGDLMYEGHKLLGSSQRKHRQAMLQHGALLLAQSQFTPSLPGIKELTGAELGVDALIEAIVAAFREGTGWHVEDRVWTSDESDRIEQIAVEKYGRAEWNEKR